MTPSAPQSRIDVVHGKTGLPWILFHDGRGRLTVGESGGSETPIHRCVAARTQCREQYPIECQHMPCNQCFRSIGGGPCCIGGSNQDRAEDKQDGAENWMFIHGLFPVPLWLLNTAGPRPDLGIDLDQGTGGPRFGSVPAVQPLRSRQLHRWLIALAGASR